MASYDKFEVTKDNLSFIERFKGKAHRIPKEGPHGVLLPSPPILVKQGSQFQRNHSGPQRPLM